MESNNNDEGDTVSVSEIDGKLLATPVHMQAAIKHLQLKSLFDYVQNLLRDDGQKVSITSRVFHCKSEQYCFDECVKVIGGVPITKAERIADRTRLYNFSRVRKKQKWMKNILVQDSSDEEITDRCRRVKKLLKIHKFRCSCARDTLGKDCQEYMHYISSIICNLDIHKDCVESNMSAIVKTESQQTESQVSDEELGYNDEYGDWLRFRHRRKRRRLSPEEAQVEQRNIWDRICREGVPDALKSRSEARVENLTKLRGISKHCMQKCRLRAQKLVEENINNVTNLSHEMAHCPRKKGRNDMLKKWKNEENIEGQYIKAPKRRIQTEVRHAITCVEQSNNEAKRSKEHGNEEQRTEEINSLKKGTREAEDQRRQGIALEEARRQQRKLNLLITQMELHAHFMSRKITGKYDEYEQTILEQLPNDDALDYRCEDPSPIDSRSAALANAQKAFTLYTMKRSAFTQISANTEKSTEQRQEPAQFSRISEAYHSKETNWLIRLYKEGLNGILSDEMGHGKTIQSLAFLAYVVETCNIWGPFLIVAPTSSLLNWQRECASFVPNLKCVPYWGNAQYKKILRKFWQMSGISTCNCPFNVIITSYQIIAQNVKYFEKVQWHYLILDEAQAIENSSSACWKVLLRFSCRNRLLLTGTHIQHNIGELWSLLHFIMPTLFDCHEEFNEWYSDNIEGHAENSEIFCDEIKRLRSILSRFMLRREKKEIENQLSQNVETLYNVLRDQISIDDLVISSGVPAQPLMPTENALMRLLMQFRKVINHTNLVNHQYPHCSMKVMLDVCFLPRLLHSIWRPPLNHVLLNILYIHHQARVAESLQEHRYDLSSESTFSFLRFVGLSDGEYYRINFSLMLRWLSILHYWRTAQRLHLNTIWESGPSNKSKFLLLDCTRTTRYPNVVLSSIMTSLVFTSTLMTSYGHFDHKIKSFLEVSRREYVALIPYVKDRGCNSSGTSTSVSSKKRDMKGPSDSPLFSKSSRKSPWRSGESETPEIHDFKATKRNEECRSISLLLTNLPKFTYLHPNRVHLCHGSWYWTSRNATLHRELDHVCGSGNALRTVLYGLPELYTDYRKRSGLVLDTGKLKGSDNLSETKDV